MAKRKSYKKPLEWVVGRINTTDDTVTNYRIELGLKDDEVAEIHKIDSNISQVVNIPTTDTVFADLMLSMDPDVIADPSVAANHDDLEVFYEHTLQLHSAFVTTGGSVAKEDETKVGSFDPPILVGTDVGMVFKGDGAQIGSAMARLYFTRRKANVMELNQILLKRR